MAFAKFKLSIKNQSSGDISLLAIPYKFTKKLVGIKSIVKIPFEILFIGFTCIMSIFYLLGSQLAVNTMQGVLISIFQNFYANYTFNSIIIGTFNILWWMIGFYILFLRLV